MNADISKSIVRDIEAGTYHIAWGMSPSRPLIQVFAVSKPISDRDDLSQHAPVMAVATWNCLDDSTKPAFDALLSKYAFRHGGAPWAPRDNT